jgi:hypothetical protein
VPTLDTPLHRISEHEPRATLPTISSGFTDSRFHPLGHRALRVSEQQGPWTRSIGPP